MGVEALDPGAVERRRHARRPALGRGHREGSLQLPAVPACQAVDRVALGHAPKVRITPRRTRGVLCDMAPPPPQTPWGS